MSYELQHKLPPSIRPANPNKDRFQYFIYNSKYIIQKLYHTDYQPVISKRTFTEKLTKYPHEGNLEYIKSLIELNNATKSLVIAPTGSGKTYSIDAIFKQIQAESTESQLLCLLCPSRIQNIQNEKSDDYSFEALIEGVCLEENDQGIRQISAVYDKLPEIRKYKKEHPECRLRVVIDECQNLISANIFREKAINAIMKLIDDKLADSYTFITATYDSMCCIAFDNITLFEDKNYKPVFESIDIRYADKKLFNNLVIETALKEDKAYIRLNDKEKIKNIKNHLSTFAKKCYSVTSDDKGYTTNKDGTVTYNNIIFDHITNHDDLYNNEGEADTILATSLLDAGTNFTKYSPKSTPVFAVTMPKMMNVDEIEQAFNRFRPQKDAAGNIIRLKHAVILQQTPTCEITRIRIMKTDEAGNYMQVSSIPPKAAVYTDYTTKEEQSQGIFNATISLPGKYFEELPTGSYTLEFVIGERGDFLSNKLYVNLYDGPVDMLAYARSLDKESLYKLLQDMNNALTALKEEDTPLKNRLANAMDTACFAPSEFDFIYNTGDETVSASCVLKPYFLIRTLLEIFDNYYTQAMQQLARFHNYRIVDNNDMEEINDFTFNSSSRSDISVTLPSLEISPTCSYISIRNENGERLVSISCPINGKITFADSYGKKLILITCTNGSLSVSILGAKYPKCGALTEASNKILKIVPAPSADEAEKENWHFNKMDIPPTSPVTIIDTIHHVKITLSSSMGTFVEGKTQKEHLEDLLNMLKLQKPDIGNALYFTSSMQLMVDYHKLFNSAYSAYQNQFFYYPEHLVAELQSRLKIPVTMSDCVPMEYDLISAEEDRQKLLCSLNTLYQNPATKGILYDVLHSGMNIPNTLEDEQRKMISEILQSKLYKKEYKKLQKCSSTITFDYIVKVLNFPKTEKDTNKHVKRLEHMIINQAIARNDKQLPFFNSAMKVQFQEQQTLTAIIDERKKSTGTKKITVNDNLITYLTTEFNKRMKKNIPSYSPKSNRQLRTLLCSTYIVINQNSKSRKPELTDPILSIDDVPFN